MPDIFFPQLALFVAGRSDLALYREFVFPSVPSRTGLLAAGIDDVRSNSPEIAPIAIDVALTKAAVVVYDRSHRGRLPQDYVEALRGSSPVVVVEVVRSPGYAQPLLQPGANSQAAVVRPSEMSGWVEDFLEPLLSKIDEVTPTPTPVDIGTRLGALSREGRHVDLLLTALALLEHQMRRDDLATSVPTNPSRGVMGRLVDHFDTDHPVVVEAVAMRHRILQDPRPDVLGTPQPVAEGADKDLRRVSSALSDVVRRRFDVPAAAGADPSDDPSPPAP